MRLCVWLFQVADLRGCILELRWHHQNEEDRTPPLPQLFPAPRMAKHSQLKQVYVFVIRPPNSLIFSYTHTFFRCCCLCCWSSQFTGLRSHCARVCGSREKLLQYLIQTPRHSLHYVMLEGWLAFNDKVLYVIRVYVQWLIPTEGQCFRAKGRYFKVPWWPHKCCVKKNQQVKNGEEKYVTATILRATYVFQR